MDLCIADILRARTLLSRYLPATPMWSYPVLDEVVGAHLRVKHENVQPTGAFKVRGGLTMLAGMPAADRERGVVTWSTGSRFATTTNELAPATAATPPWPEPTPLLAIA